MEFSRQEYCSGLPLPSPGYHPDPDTEPGSPVLRESCILFSILCTYWLLVSRNSISSFPNMQSFSWCLVVFLWFIFQRFCLFFSNKLILEVLLECSRSWNSWNFDAHCGTCCLLLKSGFSTAWVEGCLWRSSAFASFFQVPQGYHPAGSNFDSNFFLMRVPWLCQKYYFEP